MTKTLHAANRVSSASKGTHNHSIWISDALLAASFNHFARGSRRHGSHVPGPLEARRRTAKRRNTNLAYTALRESTVEASVLLGSGKKQGWWTDVQTPVEKTGMSITMMRLYHADKVKRHLISCRCGSDYRPWSLSNHRLPIDRSQCQRQTICKPQVTLTCNLPSLKQHCDIP